MKVSKCCRAPIHKENERGTGIHYVYTMVCSKCGKPTDAWDEDMSGVITTTERVIELTRRVWFQRGIGLGFVIGAVVAAVISWFVSH